MGEMEVKLVRLCPNHGPTTNYDANFNCLECGEHTKEEVITGDMAVSTYAAPATTLAEVSAARKKRTCLQFQREIADDARICPYCGISLVDGPVSPETITAVAAAGGVIGIHGLGHMMLGQIAKAFLLLFGGLFLIAGIVVSIIMAIDLWEDIYVILAIILGVVYIVLFIWQVMDANASARRRNLNFDNHGLRG
ncbi:MAG: hypothetical protein PHO26_07600 [Dehalococcoidia bacterium]|nr:hypothetical protein [Dehalococcoidia bacterium]MDD5493322.1 hypothetical protein [Dehalococcoidia bacterium]